MKNTLIVALINLDNINNTHTIDRPVGLPFSINHQSSCCHSRRQMFYCTAVIN